MWEIITKGGWLMVPILLGSVIGLGVFLERLLALTRARVAPPGLGDEVRRLLVEQGEEAALERCKGSESSLGRVLAEGLAARGRGRERQKEHLEEAGRREAARLERYVGVLGIVASIEPLLGLLGTVVGMIAVFQRVVSAGVGDPAVLAEGIWAALITTAAGLTVAIPAFIAWRYLDTRVGDHLRGLEEEALALVEAMEQEAA
ncbi:MAG: MotA/TolQ/ExbB proton channel family protein [Deltaproteobacteria bacterium]|nr:MotA/TolQ/ExbB proton channel family protein [Deltaproteobacteria bacterium]